MILTQLLIFNENNFSELENLKDSEVRDFERWKKNLREKIKKINSETKILSSFSYRQWQNRFYSTYGKYFYGKDEI